MRTHRRHRGQRVWHVKGQDVTLRARRRGVQPGSWAEGVTLPGLAKTMVPVSEVYFDGYFSAVEARLSHEEYVLARLFRVERDGGGVRG